MDETSAIPTPALATLPATEQLSLLTPPIHRWCVPGTSDTWCEFFHEPAGYRIRFPNLTDFLVTGDGTAIKAVPTDGADSETLKHLHANLISPLAANLRGLAAFHASAVDTPYGAAAFVAASGHGKSTLATSFALDGNALLTDDGLILRLDGDQAWVQPNSQSVRLWRDSLDALMGAESANSGADSHKFRIQHSGKFSACQQPKPLRCAFFLQPASNRNIAIQPMQRSHAMVEWAKHAFLMDIRSKSLLRRHFDEIATLARSGVNYTLIYPHEFDRLPDVRLAVREHLQSL